MKKSLILSMIGLMLSIVMATGANVANSTENLVFGNMWMEGSLRVGVAQRLHVEVTNNGTETYQDFWYAGAPSCYGNSDDIILAAGETKDVEVDILFEQEGHYDVIIMNSTEKKLFTYTVDIAEYQAPRLKCEIRLDMLEQTDDGNILYGDFAHFRITGTATITNEDNYPYFGLGNIMIVGRFMGIVSTAWPWFGRDNFSGMESIYGLSTEIKPRETITKDIFYEFVAEPEEDKEYGIQIRAAVETDAIANITIASITFKVRQCTNTYWTADGHVKPLPVKDNQVLEIPAEALTVDMRGQYEMNTIFSVDVSQANPNCLYFLGYLDNVPQGFSSTQNVIRDYEAKMITIDGDRDYYCPMPFKAKEVLFNYIPESIDPTLSRMTNGTVVLPFDATKAWLPFANDSPGNDAAFNGNTLQIFRYSGGNSGDKIGFEPVWENHLIAYEPYYIFSPPSPITFYAENVIIPSTRPAMTKGAEYDFIGYTTQIAVPDGAYQWNADDCCFYLSNLEEKITWASPFSAMMYAKTIPYNYDKLVLVDGAGGGATRIDAIRDIPSEKATAVYSLSGQRIGTAEVNEGRLTTSGLRPGIYIIGEKKVIVK